MKNRLNTRKEAEALREAEALKALKEGSRVEYDDDSVEEGLLYIYVDPSGAHSLTHQSFTFADRQRTKEEAIKEVEEDIKVFEKYFINVGLMNREDTLHNFVGIFINDLGNSRHSILGIPYEEEDLK